MKTKQLFDIIDGYNFPKDKWGQYTDFELLICDEDDEVTWPLEIISNYLIGNYKITVYNFDDFCTIINYLSDPIYFEKDILINYYLQLDYFSEHIEPILKENNYKMLGSNLLNQGFPPVIEYGDPKNQVSYIYLEYDIFKRKLYMEDREGFPHYIEEIGFIEYIMEEIKS